MPLMLTEKHHTGDSVTEVMICDKVWTIYADQLQQTHWHLYGLVRGIG